MNNKIIRIPTSDMSRADWLKERRNSLGGSDMGAVLGLNPWRSPYAVWAEKTGKLADEEENEAMRIGRDLEDYVAKRFCELSGRKVQRVNAILRNPELPHVHANVDRVLVGSKEGLECKTASALNQKRYAGGEFPASYYAQCVTYLAVTEYERWYLAVLVMGREFKVYQMTRIPDDPCPEWCEASVYVSEDEIKALAAAAAEFWRHVEDGTPPPVDGLQSTNDAIREIFAEEHDETVDLDAPVIRMAIKDYAAYAEAEKRAKEAKDGAANIIKTYLGGAVYGVGELAKVSWKNQTRESFDRKRFEKEHPEIEIMKYVKQSTSRVFRLTVQDAG